MAANKSVVALSSGTLARWITAGVRGWTLVFRTDLARLAPWASHWTLLVRRHQVGRLAIGHYQDYQPLPKLK